MGDYDHANSVIKDGLKIARRTDGERFRSRGLGSTVLVSEAKLAARTFEAQKFRDSAIREIVVSIAKLGEHSNNRETIDEALNVLTEIKDQSIKISAMCEVASSLGMMDDIPQATAMLTDALNSAKMIQDDFYRTITLCNIADSFADIGDLRFVDGIIQQSIETAYRIRDEFYNSWALRKIVETLLKISQTTTDPRYVIQSCNVSFWISNDKDYWYCARMISEMLVSIVTLPYELSKSIERFTTELADAENEGIYTKDIRDKLTNAKTNLQNRNYPGAKRNLYQGKVLLRHEKIRRQLRIRVEKEIESLKGLFKSLEGLDLENAKCIFTKVQDALKTNDLEKALGYAKDCHDAISAARIVGTTALKVSQVMSERLVANVWNVAEVTVKNVGMTDVKDLSIQFTPPIQVLGTTTLSNLKPREKKKFELSIKSTEIGKFPVRVVVTCKDEHKRQRTFESDKDFWVEVVKE
jgi:hypothetical protein